MKRLIFLFLFTLTFVVSASSQKFFGGLIAGGTMSQVAGDARGGYHKIGIVGGAFAGLRLSDDFDIQLELKYIQKGSLSNDVENNPDFDPFLIKLDYVDLPIVLSYNLNKLNINDVNLGWMKLEAGLSLDVLVNARQEIQGVTVPASNPWNRFVVNTILGVRMSVAKNIEIGIRTINDITSNCNVGKSPYNNGNVNYVQRLLPYYGMFNDVLQIALFWKI